MEQSYKTSNELVRPIIYSNDYKNSFKEIIYFNTNDPYSKFQIPYIYVDYKKYLTDINTFINPIYNIKNDINKLHAYKYHAFGAVFNLYNTKIIPIDIDNLYQIDITSLCDIIINDSLVSSIDIINSSTIKRWHIIIGLKEYVNIKYYLPLFPNICKGFSNVSIKNREAILRVSQKFYTDMAVAPISYILSYRKKENEIYCSSNYDYHIT